MATKKQIRDRDETIAQFCAHVQARGLGVPIDMIIKDVDWLHRQETTLHRLAETACNRELTDAEIKKQATIESRVSALLGCYDIPVRFEGDPRGGTIRMRFASGASNNWGGEDWGIYW